MIWHCLAALFPRREPDHEIDTLTYYPSSPTAAATPQPDGADLDQNRATGAFEDTRDPFGGQLPTGFVCARTVLTLDRDDPTLPGSDELEARHRMVAAMDRYGWEKGRTA
jgi:hypothetical protein